MTEAGGTTEARGIDRTAPMVAGAGQALREAGECRAEGHRARSGGVGRLVAPFAMSLAGHVLLGTVILVAAGTVVLLGRDPQESPVIVANFDALAYDPVSTPSAGAPTGQMSGGVREPLFTELSLGERTTIAPGGTGRMGAPTGTGISPGDFGPARGDVSVEFVGLKTGNARRIVYVLDASGSMVAHLPFVVDELKRSLSTLSEQQSFGVVFFQRNQSVWAPPANALTRATEEEKSRVDGWIRTKVIPRGRSNPLEALRSALRLKPDVVFLLSTDITGSGEFEIDQKDLLAELERANPLSEATGRRPVQINCVQFLDPDPLGTLERIAEAHGGKHGFRFVSRQDLGLESP